MPDARALTGSYQLSEVRMRTEANHKNREKGSRSSLGRITDN
jgi:hypothetical protein